MAGAFDLLCRGPLSGHSPIQLFGNHARSVARDKLPGSWPDDLGCLHRELRSVLDPDFVENRMQIRFHGAFRGVEPVRNFAVLQALAHQRDQRALSLRQTTASTPAGQGGDALRNLLVDPRAAPFYGVDRVDQVRRI